ncbi:MAG: cryptochrome/photolyase family protein, partial [Acidiphilium sp. 21-62-4]
MPQSLTAALRVILGDQLSRGIASLADIDPQSDVVLMAEVLGECTYVPHHPQKIAMILAAMRHFAQALTARGIKVRYIPLDDPDNTGTLSDEVARAVHALHPTRIIATEPGEYRVREAMRNWSAETGIPCEIREDTRFLATADEFAQWAEDRKQLRMEFFYRVMRRKHRILMEGEEPVGGRWNFDSENRKSLPETIEIPTPLRFAPSAETTAVIDLVAARFAGHYGTLDRFDYPVTAQDA